MTNLEKRAEEYLVNHFCKKVDEEYMIEECNSGERSRCVSFEERKEILIEFAQSETELLAKHILELQKTNGALTDRIDELENKLENIRYYLDNEIPIEFINEATTIIYKMV